MPTLLRTPDTVTPFVVVGRINRNRQSDKSLNLTKRLRSVALPLHCSIATHDEPTDLRSLYAIQNWGNIIVITQIIIENCSSKVNFLPRLKRLNSAFVGARVVILIQKANTTNWTCIKRCLSASPSFHADSGSEKVLRIIFRVR